MALRVILPRRARLWRHFDVQMGLLVGDAHQTTSKSTDPQLRKIVMFLSLSVSSLQVATLESREKAVVLWHTTRLSFVNGASGVGVRGGGGLVTGCAFTRMRGADLKCRHG